MRGKRNDIWNWGRLPIIRRERDEDQPFGVVRDVIEEQRAMAFLGAALAEGEEAAQSAVSGAFRRIGEEARGVLQVETRADDQLDADLAGREMRAHDAGQRVGVGDGDGRVA